MEPQNLSNPNWQVKVFASAIRNQKYIFWFLRLGYTFILTINFLAFYSSITKNPDYYTTYYNWALYFSKSAIVLLGIVVLPGILGRLGVKWQATRIITFFRRQLGITVFLLAFSHYSILRAIPIVTGQMPYQLPGMLFEVMGTIALFILFIMYLTSNNWSMKKLGPWWKRSHQLIYIVLWLLVLHTGLQRISVWTFIIGFFAVLEVVSLVYAKFKSKPIIPQA